MKIIWETDDIAREGAAAAGTIVTNDSEEYWMIGYRPGADKAQARYCLISLRDGMIQDPMTAEALAAHLTETNMKPITERSMIENYVKDGRSGNISL